jgi:hypothetical protein
MSCPGASIPAESGGFLELVPQGTCFGGKSFRHRGSASGPVELAAPAAAEVATITNGPAQTTSGVDSILADQVAVSMPGRVSQNWCHDDHSDEKSGKAERRQRNDERTPHDHRRQIPECGLDADPHRIQRAGMTIDDERHGHDG